MFFSPIRYIEPLFRPPSEAYSLILQITYGCSWSRCAFCEMYSTKKFRVRPEDEVIREIRRVAPMFRDVRKIFLADGNAMVLSTARLMRIIEVINECFPKLQRISAYALPGDLLPKKPEELRQLRDAGLKLVYVGIESGDDEVLRLVDKGETRASTVEGLQKAREAGIRSSVMILTGLGGMKYSEQHAINSARILNDVQPYYASTLVLSFPFGEKHYSEKFQGDYISMTTADLLRELEIFISHTELDSTIFRSDHASNYLVLKGVLSKDKEHFLEDIRYALNNPEILRKEWMRGL
ncbi:MAG: radical SAM protein [Bacteroidetes bacterium]|nr:radical SAM protein [Bacteroidota bacterium]